MRCSLPCLVAFAALSVVGCSGLRFGNPLSGGGSADNGPDRLPGTIALGEGRVAVEPSPDPTGYFWQVSGDSEHPHDITISVRRVVGGRAYRIIPDAQEFLCSGRHFLRIGIWRTGAIEGDGDRSFFLGRADWQDSTARWSTSWTFALPDAVGVGQTVRLVPHCQPPQ